MAPSPSKLAVAEPANHAARKAKMSGTATVPFWSKSARQQGSVLLPCALHAEPAPWKLVLLPVHEAASVTIQMPPEQHAPVWATPQGLGSQMVNGPCQVVPGMPAQLA